MRHLTTVLGATLLGLMGCATEDTTFGEPVEMRVEETVVETFEEPTPQEIDVDNREYGVFATDDSPVNGPELADLFYDGRRLADCPYKPYSKENRIPGDFRIGQLPEDLVLTGPTRELRGMLDDAAGDPPGLGLRVAVVFTGPRFEETLEDAKPYLRKGTASMEGYEFETWRTKAGTFYKSSLANGEDFGIMIFGHSTFFSALP